MARFSVGNVGDCEFRVPDTIGWVDTIGVAPVCQMKGLATAQANILIENPKVIRVKDLVSTTTT